MFINFVELTTRRFGACKKYKSSS